MWQNQVLNQCLSVLPLTVHRILYPGFPEVLVKAQKNKFHSVPLKLRAGGWYPFLVSPDVLLARPMGSVSDEFYPEAVFFPFFSRGL